MGTRKTLTIEALSPVLASILGSILLNEMLSIKAWIGILIVSISLLGITFQDAKKNEEMESKDEISNFNLVQKVDELGFIPSINKNYDADA